MPPKNLTLLPLLLCFYVVAQDSAAIRSLTARITASESDTATVMLYNQLFVEYRDYDSNAAMNVINKGIDLSHRSGDAKGESLLLLNKATFLNFNGEGTEAEKLVNQSLQIRIKTNDFAGQGHCLRTLGTIQYDRNDYQKALQYFLDAVPLFEKANDQRGLSGNYIWIGNVFNEGLKQFDKAVTYFNKSLLIAEQQKDSSLIGYNYNNLGIAYFNAKNFSQSLDFYRRSRQLKQLLGDVRGIGNAFGNMSNVYFEQKNYPLTLTFNDSSLRIRQQQNDKKGVATCYLNGANIHLATNQLEAAYANYQKAIQLGTEIGFREAVIESYNGLSNYYEKKGNATAALEYFKKYKAASDSVYNAAISEQIQTLQVKFETAQNQKQIQQQQFEITQKNYLLYGSVALFLLGCLLGYNYYRRYKLKREKQLQSEIIKQQDLATRAVLQAEETERQQIAQELHDGVGQMMSAAKMNLSAMENDLAFTNENQRIAYDRVIGLVDDSCKEVRTVSHQMMPNALLKKGLGNAIREFVDRIDNRVIKVDLYSEGLNDTIDTSTETVLYRVVQECVNNVIKHSGANHLDISLIRDDDGLSVTIEDNGKGFDVEEKMKIDGMGLKNIRTRISYLKGTVDFDSTPGNGTLVAIHVPHSASTTI